MDLTLMLAIGIVAGFIFGVILGRVRKKHTELVNVGTLQIIHSADEEPYMFLSLETDIETVSRNKIVVLNVTTKSVPQK